MSQVTAVSPLTEREFTYVRSVRELGAGNGPLLLFCAIHETCQDSNRRHQSEAVGWMNSLSRCTPP